MDLVLQRYSDNGESTLGILTINQEFQCYTLEDEWQAKKVYGETRIPAGIYDLKLRTEGGFHNKYKKRFDFHKGMIQIMNVPGFEYILIHCGNDDGDTAGCILVGNSANNNQLGDGFISNSTDAYKVLYQKIIDIIADGNSRIIIQDEICLR